MSKQESENSLLPSREDEFSRCKVCCEPINARAIKCTKCGSYQDWTRHLLRWSALLITLFGLAPLWSISNSLSKLSVDTKVAHIEAALTACEKDSVRLVFENSGEISGIITDITFALLQDGQRTVPGLELRNNLEDEQDILVIPDQPPVRVTYSPYIGNTKASFISESQSHENCLYQLQVKWIDFAGSHQQLSRECGCP